MPEILPPQFAGVQQRPFYVKARSVITAISIVWLVLAVAGYGSFSGGTTSLALSLAMMYGTGVAIMVVASAVYRLVKRSALRRTETAPEDTAAAVFVDATRFAAEELMAALSPSRSGSRPAASAWPAARPVEAARPQDTSAAPDSAPAAQRPVSAGAGVPAEAGVLAQAGREAAKTQAARPQAPSAGKPAAPRPAVAKSVVNKKAAAKKKKGSKPRGPKPGSAVPHSGSGKQPGPELKRAA